MSNVRYRKMKTKKFTASELEPEKIYRVISEFKDFDGTTHKVGESWRFKRDNFVPHDDGLSLFVEINEVETQIRLQWRAESQAGIIESFSDKVKIT